MQFADEMTGARYSGTLTEDTAVDYSRIVLVLTPLAAAAGNPGELATGPTTPAWTRATTDRRGREELPRLTDDLLRFPIGSTKSARVIEKKGPPATSRRPFVELSTSR